MNVNNQSYDFGQASFFMLGRNVQGIKGVNFSEEQDAQFNYGAGNEALTVSRGQRTVTGNLTLMAFEVIALQKANSGNSLLSLPAFNLLVSFGNDPSQMSATTVKSIIFTKIDRGIDQANSTDDVTIDFIAGSIETV